MKLAVGLALAGISAGALNWGFYAQHGATRGLPRLSPRRPLRSLRLLFTSRRWLAGYVTGIGGWALYVAALVLAPLSLVQATSAGGIGLLALLAARAQGSPLASRERMGVATALAGLVLLGLSLAGQSPGSDRGSAVAIASWVGASAALAGLAAGPVGMWLAPGAGLGAASGLLYAAGDVATKAAVSGGERLVFLAVMAACHGAAFVSLQMGFQRGRALPTAGASSVITNAVPIAAGVVLFHEVLPLSPLGALRVAAFVEVVLAACLLVRGGPHEPADGGPRATGHAGATVGARAPRADTHPHSMKVTWQQALAFRMRRHLLDPIGAVPIARVVRRLCGVQAQVASSAELAVRVRRRTSRPGEVGRALSDGRLVKTWAMRGALHLLTPEEAGVFLSLIAAGRSWERPSWQRYFGVTADAMDVLRRVVREALDGAVLTREELVAAVIARRELGHAGEALRSGWGTLLKPLAWQGDLCFGPNRGRHVTFMRPEAASERWAGVPPPEEAAPAAIAAYFSAYGPATIDAFGNWLSGGWFGKRQLRTWFGALGDRMAEVAVDGEPAYVLAEDLDELSSSRPTTAVRLLPGFDQYVLGPGTGDGHVVPAGRRAMVSKQSGWIAPVVVVGGAVKGTWELDGERVRIGWFREVGRPPRKELEAEVARLSSILERELDPEISLA